MKREGISFEPSKRGSKSLARVIAVSLLTTAIATSAYGVIETRASEPLLAGVKAPGTVIQVEGKVLQIDYAYDNFTYTTKKRVESAKQGDVGRVVTVYFDEEDPNDIFIDGIDKVEVIWTYHWAAAIQALIGLVLLVRPFRIRTR